MVVLDEATAHLDSESEVAIQRALATALAGRTSLVIAHRLSTVRAADQILVVDGGQIAERGTHDELLAAGGVYAGLYRTQFAPQAGLRPIPEEGVNHDVTTAGSGPGWQARAGGSWWCGDNGRMDERLEVRRAVAASPGEIFAVLTDPRGHVAIDSSGMLMGASGDAVAAVGDTFVVHMDREALNDRPLGLYDVTVKILTFEQDREIAWTVRGRFNIGHVYGYRLERIEAGTLVTSYYDWSMAEQSWKDSAIFPVVPESALRATLAILARTAAPGKPRPGAESP